MCMRRFRVVIAPPRVQPHLRRVSPMRPEGIRDRTDDLRQPDSERPQTDSRGDTDGGQGVTRP